MLNLDEYRELTEEYNTLAFKTEQVGNSIILKIDGEIVANTKYIKFSEVKKIAEEITENKKWTIADKIESELRKMNKYDFVNIYNIYAKRYDYPLFINMDNTKVEKVFKGKTVAEIIEATKNDCFSIDDLFYYWDTNKEYIHSTDYPQLEDFIYYKSIACAVLEYWKDFKDLYFLFSTELANEINDFKQKGENKK